MSTNPEQEGEPSDEDGRPARAELLARLTHEVASPVGVLAGALQELRECVAPEAEAKRYFRLAERALERLVRLSRELDDAAELEGMGDVPLPLEPEQTDLRQIVEAGCQQVAALEPRVFEVLETRLPDAPARATVDVSRMTRVVDLLVAAAVRVARSRVRITLEAADDLLELCIEDDGPPLSEPRRRRVFDRFAARLPRGRDRGVVFGLSIAHDYVIAHGGRITVEEGRNPLPGSPGPGVRLRVTVPRTSTGGRRDAQIAG